MVVVFHSVKLSNRLIDFVYQDSDGHFHAFQATLADTHSANVDDIVNLERMVGGTAGFSVLFGSYVSVLTNLTPSPSNPGRRERGATFITFRLQIRGQANQCSKPAHKDRYRHSKLISQFLC
jgi:hypothetical protein